MESSHFSVEAVASLPITVLTPADQTAQVPAMTLLHDERATTVTTAGIPSASLPVSTTI